MKVICKNAGLHDLCIDCGARVPHDHEYCEPCPIDDTAVCVPISKKFFYSPYLNELRENNCFHFKFFESYENMKLEQHILFLTSRLDNFIGVTEIWENDIFQYYKDPFRTSFIRKK